LGQRKLAYQIEHFYNAYYIIVEFESKSTEIPALENYLRLAEEILRHLIVKKRVKSEDERSSDGFDCLSHRRAVA